MELYVGGEELTVFAPFNGAFEEIPEKDLNGLVMEGQQKGQVQQKQQGQPKQQDITSRAASARRMS